MTTETEDLLTAEEEAEGLDALAQLFAGLDKAEKEFAEKNTEVKDTDAAWGLTVDTSKCVALRPGFGGKLGDWVSIRPCGDKYGDKTFLGIYLGDLAIDHFIRAYEVKETGKKVVEVYGYGNPAIYVPELKEIIMGAASWWGVIKKPEDLKKITDQDIQNVWYVKALKELSEKAGA